MILIPDIQGCTIITEKGFCSLVGTPYDIVYGLFVKETNIDDVTSIISPRVSTVSLLINGQPIDEVYKHLLETLHIKANLLFDITPDKIFEGER